MMYEHGEEYDEHLVAALKQLYDARGEEITHLNALLAAYRDALRKGEVVYDFGKGSNIFVPMYSGYLDDADLDAAVLAAAEPHDPH